MLCPVEIEYGRKYMKSSISTGRMAVSWNELCIYSDLGSVTIQQEQEEKQQQNTHV